MPIDQPAIESAVGAPLQVVDVGDVTLVGYRGRGGEFRVLKQF